jgi:spermidine synthase
VQGRLRRGSSRLARFAGDAPLNTDDRRAVAYSAPRITYVPDSLPRDRLIALLRETEIKPDELVAADSTWSSRLANYWTARNRFIEAGRDISPTADVRRMLAQVREPLLAVLRISPDFRPAYDPLLRMAGALARIDVPAARDLLTELQRVQPSRRKRRWPCAISAGPVDGHLRPRTLYDGHLFRPKTETGAATAVKPKPNHSVAIYFKHIQYLPLIGPQTLSIFV